MGGCGDDIAVGQGIGMDLRRDESGGMGDIGHEIGSRFVGDLAESGEIDEPGISGGACDDLTGFNKKNSQAANFQMIGIKSPGG